MDHFYVAFSLFNKTIFYKLRGAPTKGFAPDLALKKRLKANSVAYLGYAAERFLTWCLRPVFHQRHKNRWLELWNVTKAQAQLSTYTCVSQVRTLVLTSPVKISLIGDRAIVITELSMTFCRECLTQGAILSAKPAYIQCNTASWQRVGNFLETRSSQGRRSLWSVVLPASQVRPGLFSGRLLLQRRVSQRENVSAEKGEFLSTSSCRYLSYKDYKRESPQN